MSLYRCFIRSLLYLTASRPDIIFVGDVCVRYQAYPKTNYLLSPKKTIKYIRGTSEYHLLYSFDTNSSLVEYCDVD